MRTPGTLTKDVEEVGLVDPIELLHEKERLLAVRYGADHPPKLPDEDQLQSEEPADAEHWMQVYSELVGFLHRLEGSAPAMSPADGRQAEDRRQQRRAMALEAKVHELHLAFWTDRLKNLRGDSGSDQGD